MTKDENINTISKEVIIYGNSDKELCEVTKASGDGLKGSISSEFDDKIKKE